ncbi:MAG: TldD/PmbA family protein [Nitrospiria bacterium]
MWQSFASKIFHLARKENVDYTDVRLIPSHEEESILVRNGEIHELAHSRKSGFGIRILKTGAWGFASSSRLDETEIEEMFEKAVSLARASSIMQRNPVRLYQVPVIVKGFFKTPVLKDPFKDVSLQEKISKLLELDSLMKQSSSKVNVREANMTFTKINKIFINSEGSFIEQELVESGAGMEVIVVSGAEVQRRSYPNSFRGNMGTAGYEFIESLHLENHAVRIGEEAEALLYADPCPEGDKDLILMPDQLCLQIHESIGHAIELDRIFGSELTYAGGSFLSGHLKEIGTFRYGSPLVNIISDATLKEGLGSFGYDDEAVAAQKTDIIREGVWVGLLSSRETSQEFREITGKSIVPNGCMRASHSNRVPLIRMTNLVMEPGKGSLNELLSETRDGILMETNVSWSIDDLRKNFSFGAEIGWEIKDGKKTRMLKNPFYTGVTVEFWNSCDAVCGPSEWKSYGTPNCGKGIPGQAMHVGHGASPARFKKVRVGSRKD